MGERSELDASRAAVAARGLVPVASQHLTETIAMRLPFESLGTFKNLLRQFFSTDRWTAVEAAALSNLVTPHLDAGEWHVPLDDELTLHHAVIDGTYVLEVTGVAGGGAGSVFDRVYSGPVIPEATPHPRKVKFHLGGEPAPGIWYRRGEPTDDAAVARLFGEPDVTDVMVAGDFVTVGLAADSSWEDRLEPIVELIAEHFPTSEARPVARTREELMREGGRLGGGEALHLLDPDLAEHRARLIEVQQNGDTQERRIAVAILAESSEPDIAEAAITAGRHDRSLTVRRTALDAAADLEDERYRSLFEEALGDPDPWTRWKAVRALRDLGVGPSEDAVAGLADDPDFHVRMEVAAALRGDIERQAPPAPPSG